MWFDLIVRLQNRSRHERHFAALMIAVSITGFISLIWISTLVSRLGNDGGSVTESAPPQQASIIQAFGAQVGEFQNILEEVVTSVQDFGDTIEYQSEESGP